MCLSFHGCIFLVVIFATFIVLKRFFQRSCSHHFLRYLPQTIHQGRSQEFHLGVKFGVGRRNVAKSHEGVRRPRNRGGGIFENFPLKWCILVQK